MSDTMDLTSLETRTLVSGQSLYAPGEVLPGAWLLQSGALILRQQLSERRATCTWERSVDPGEWLGLGSMLDGGPCMHHAVATEPSTLGFISRDQLALWLDRGDPQGPALLRRWLALQARELARVNAENVRILRLAAEF